jgi:hypothetical protein
MNPFQEKFCHFPSWHPKFLREGPHPDFPHSRLRFRSHTAWCNKTTWQRYQNRLIYSCHQDGRYCCYESEGRSPIQASIPLSQLIAELSNRQHRHLSWVIKCKNNRLLLKGLKIGNSCFLSECLYITTDTYRQETRELQLQHVVAVLVNIPLHNSDKEGTTH